MMDEFGLGAFVAGAVVYQAAMMLGLVGWLWKRGVRTPGELDIGPESTAERRKMSAVVVLFWVACVAIIVGGW
jgi:hypothetical protein